MNDKERSPRILQFAQREFLAGSWIRRFVKVVNDGCLVEKRTKHRIIMTKMEVNAVHATCSGSWDLK